MYGTRSQGISQFYLHTPRSSANGISHTCLCLPSQSWYSFTDPGGMEGWVGLGLGRWPCYIACNEYRTFLFDATWTRQFTSCVWKSAAALVVSFVHDKQVCHATDRPRRRVVYAGFATTSDTCHSLHSRVTVPLSDDTATQLLSTKSSAADWHVYSTGQAYCY